ncbi:MAG: DUF6298 domain-containing protein [Bacteroidales bacterium]
MNLYENLNSAQTITRAICSCARDWCLPLAFLALLFTSCGEREQPVTETEPGAIRVYKENPWYFQYKGEPLLLLGASDYHNIFQRPDLIEHLDRMQSAGGNYVRNTMASRELLPDHNDLWPYHIVEETDDPLINIYDLDRWNDEYWSRFATMLEETHKRGIIVEIELWERHDTYRTRDQAGWLRHPYNPDNNINLTAEESGLPTGEWHDPQNHTGHPFFNSVPGLMDLPRVLEYQEAFIGKLLSYTVDYDHILYNMNNETQEPVEFGKYWARHLLEWAGENEKHIELTDMQDNHDVTEEPVKMVMDSDLYTFVDISQNNFQKGETHWQRIEYIRNYLKEDPMPVTNIKVYGADSAPPMLDFWGDTDEALQRYWRSIIGGCASVRFHRPPWGIGLNDIAYNNLKSMRMITDSMDFFNHLPSNHLISNRDPNEAYCMSYDGNEFLLYFPAGGSVFLDATQGEYELMWLRTHMAEWQEAYNLELPGIIETPDEDHWAVLIKRR